MTKDNTENLPTKAMGGATTVVDVKYQKQRRKERGERQAVKRKREESNERAIGCAHATTTQQQRRRITDHNDIPPRLSPVFSTSLSSPSLLALGKGRKIGLASNPTVARIVGLDIPGEPIMGLENPKLG